MLESSVDDELDRWLRLTDHIEKDCDPFLYWFKRSFDYPRLTRMAIDIFFVPSKGRRMRVGISLLREHGCSETMSAASRGDRCDANRTVMVKNGIVG